MKKRNAFGLMGILCLIAAFRLGYQAVQEYRTDLARRDWPETMAVVTQVESWEERVTSGTKKNRRTRYETLYNVVYTYEVEGRAYTGTLERHRTAYAQGETMQIKYDPENHHQTTVRLEPSLYDLIVPLCCSAVFAVLGYFTSGLWAWQRRLRGKENGESEPPGI